MNKPEYTQYRVWDVPTRLFHWINFIAIICLIFFGLIMLFKPELGISGNEAKIALKRIHVLIGYVFVLNLLVRILWGFIGNPHARWRSIIPGKGFAGSARGYLAALAAGRPQQFIGHNPLGRLAICVLFTLLVVMAVTGLIRAGTDIYYPPFGSLVAGYIVQEGVDPGQLIPYDPAGVDEAKAARLKAFKKPFGLIHIYTSYVLMFLIVVHIAAVVITEIREGGGIISAMITGRKVLSEPPADADEQATPTPKH